MEEPGWLTLPGSARFWPEDVQIGSETAIVLAHQEKPSIQLAAGDHIVTGAFVWERLPKSLQVPEASALISLTVEGTEVSASREGSRLWLRNATVQREEQKAQLRVEVYRKLVDTTPFSIRTHLRIQVSGSSREVLLNGGLLAGAVATQVLGDLPVRLLEDGRLQIQLSPGTHNIELDAVLPAPPEQLTPPQPPLASSGQEWWSIEAHPEHRQLKIVGAQAVDPTQAAVPSEWQQLTTYAVRDQPLQLTTVSRGDAQAPNALRLKRNLWLSLDGWQYAVQDHIQGGLHHDWRLDLRQGELQQVSVDGKPAVITRSPVDGLSGIELRRNQLNVRADWTLASGGHLPAVGWSDGVTELSATLHLPPGWRVFAASGMDSSSDTWLSNWNLFDLFFLLILSLAVARLTHPTWGALTLVTLALIHSEHAAPQWTWVGVVLALAALRVGLGRLLPRLLSPILWTCGLALVLTCINFGTQQIRTALYPQTAQPRSALPGTSYGSTAQPEQAMDGTQVELEPRSAAPQPPTRRAASSIKRRASEMAKGSSSIDGRVPKLESKRAQEDAVAQTGKGTPSWRWKRWDMNWSGPVHRDHPIRLWLLSPRANLILSFLRVGLCGLLTYLLLSLLYSRQHKTSSPSAAVPLAASYWLIPFGLLLLAPTPAHAESADRTSQQPLQVPAPSSRVFPNGELLEQLKRKLAPSAECTGPCLEVTSANVEATPDRLLFSAEIHAGRSAPYQLPGPVAEWAPSEVLLDGRIATALRLHGDGFIYLLVPAGRHHLELKGASNRSAIALHLGTPPHRLTASGQGWKLSGIPQRGGGSGPLHLTRPLSDRPAASGAPRDVGAAAGWLVVTRQLTLGRQFTVRTQIKELGNADHQRLLVLPLLEGESVTDGEIKVDGKAAAINLAPGVKSFEFLSTLPRTDSLQLLFEGNARFSERWIVNCEVTASCQFSGIAPVGHEQGGKSLPRFAPWPGESLKISIHSPVVAPGPSLAIDGAALELTPGTRRLQAKLDAQLRLNADQQLTLQLPADAELESLKIDGVEVPKSRTANTYTLSLSPGSKRLQAAWQEAGGMAMRFSSPKLRLGSALANAQVKVKLPRDRWLLWASGPAWGPAILFWGQLVLIILLAPVLSRIPRSPLKAWQWGLLGLGLSQVSVPSAALVAGWFFLVANISRRVPKRRWTYNLRQLALLLATLTFLGLLSEAVYDSLLSSPDMAVEGNGSSSQLLSWYVDRTEGALPQVQVLSAPLWVWRVTMLGWALWLAASLLRWLRWGWTQCSNGGIWRQRPPSKPDLTAPMEPIAVPSDTDASPSTWRTPGTEEPNETGHSDSLAQKQGATDSDELLPAERAAPGDHEEARPTPGESTNSESQQNLDDRPTLSGAGVQPLVRPQGPAPGEGPPPEGSTRTPPAPTPVGGARPAAKKDAPKRDDEE